MRHPGRPDRGGPAEAVLQQDRRLVGSPGRAEIVELEAELDLAVPDRSGSHWLPPAAAGACFPAQSISLWSSAACRPALRSRSDRRLVGSARGQAGYPAHWEGLSMNGTTAQESLRE